MEIKFKGETLNTKYFDETVTEQDMLQGRKEYYQKPTIEKVRKTFLRLHRNRTDIFKPVIDYYIKEIMNDTVLWHCKWSINDVFECPELYSVFVNKIEQLSRFFPEGATFADKLDTCFRIAGKGIAAKPTNFNYKTVKEIINKYNLNGNYYDPSCGWSVRLLGALGSKVNYFGTDPNSKLVPKLLEIAKEYQKETGSISNVDIREQGSEIFVPEWSDKMGLIFTSPPYFFLEDYKHGQQSCANGTTYQDWLETYMRGSVKNYQKYLIKNGHVIINIKDYGDFKLESDTIRIFKEESFEHIDTLTLKNGSRVNVANNKKFNVDSTESMFVFQRKNDKPIETDLGEW